MWESRGDKKQSTCVTMLLQACDLYNCWRLLYRREERATSLNKDTETNWPRKNWPGPRSKQHADLNPKDLKHCEESFQPARYQHIKTKHNDTHTSQHCIILDCYHLVKSPVSDKQIKHKWMLSNFFHSLMQEPVKFKTFVPVLAQIRDGLRP